MTAALLAAVLLAPQAEATFSDRDLGLSFRHPREWRVERTDRLSSTIWIPLPNTTERAELVLNITSFNASAETWQTIQLRANEQLKHSVVRQWEQSVLSVPMLFTKANLSGGTQTRLTGLLYAKRDRKLLARLTAPKERFEEAEFLFLSVLESMRTLDGKELEIEDPDRRPGVRPARPTPNEPRPAPAQNRVTRFEAPNARAAAAKPEIQLELKLPTRTVNLGTPRGWTIEDKGDRAFLLRHTSGVTVDGALRLNAADAPATRELVRLTVESLALMDVVTERKERPIGVNGGGSQAVSVFRIGKTATGTMLSFDATAIGKEAYVLLTVRIPDGKREVLATLEALLDVLSVELS